MFIDDTLLFSDAQAVTATAVSSNIVNTSVARDLGNGNPLYVVIAVTTTFTNTGTVEVALQGDSTSTISPDGTHDLGVLAAGSLAGRVYVFPIPPALAAAGYQYLQLNYTVSGTVSAGNVTSFIASGYHSVAVYADNTTIS